MKKTKKLLSSVAGALSLFLVSATSTFAASEQVDYKVDLAADGDFQSNAIGLLNYFLGFLGLLAVAIVIYAGILMLTAQGQEEQLGKAKKILIWAVLGIVTIMMSFVIVQAIFGANNAGI